MSLSFHYTAFNQQGALQKGTIHAENAKMARHLLREQNLLPISVYTAQENKIGFSQLLKNLLPTQQLSAKDLALLTRQLATLLSAGLPLTEVLTAVAEHSVQACAQTILRTIKAKVMAGQSLAAALGDYPQFFSGLFCGLIKAGEKSGHLVLVLKRLADYTEQQYTFKQKISQALIYPLTLAGVSVAIIIFLLQYVMPKMIAIYSHLHQQLPWITQILMALSTGIEAWGVYLLAAALFGGWRFYAALKKNEPFREKFQRILLRIPLLGKAIQIIHIARFSQTLAMLCSSGIPIIDGLKTASAIISNLPIRKALLTATERIREGANIHLALKQTNFFPPFAIHLIASGEMSGEIVTVLEHSARQQEEEFFRFMDTLLKLFEPALILFMGGIVLFIVLAILLPIFDLNQLTL